MNQMMIENNSLCSDAHTQHSPVKFATRFHLNAKQIDRGQSGSVQQLRS